MLETFFRTHRYLLEHMGVPVRRALMDEINWRDRLIGIKGSRGVGKTTFLLQYARENFGMRDRRCLYVNMNHFYFQGHALHEFAGEFVRSGGQVLLIDQVFKQPRWSQEIRLIYDRYPHLRVVFTGSSVMRLKEENPELCGLVSSYNLRGFSLREYINIRTGLELRPHGLREILNRHERIADEVLAEVNPMEYFETYLHYGYYPFFLEKTDFTENLLKVMNMMIEVDILHIQQIELKYLCKIKKLLYLLATNNACAPNVSQLATDVATSRATVMNYIKYLNDARLINMVFRNEDKFPKKPARLLMHNTNLMYALAPREHVDRQLLLETFFQNALWGRHDLAVGDRRSTFFVDGDQRYRIVTEDVMRRSSDVVYVQGDILKGKDLTIPLWMYGFLY